MEKCKCEWCHNAPNPSGKGYCRKHYDQVRKYGEILQTRSKTDKNRILVKGDIAEIILTDAHDEYKGTAVIDTSEVARVSAYRWTLSDNGYVRTYKGTTPLYLHRFICDYFGELVIDHINRNKLDNRKANLRVATPTLNNLNKPSCGVTIDKRQSLKKRYIARVNTKRYFFFKRYATEEEARVAYETAKAIAMQIEQNGTVVADAV